jgi:hypothetical protein
VWRCTNWYLGTSVSKEHDAPFSGYYRTNLSNDRASHHKAGQYPFEAVLHKKRNSPCGCVLNHIGVLQNQGLRITILHRLVGPNTNGGMADAELPCKLATTAWSIHIFKARLAMDDSRLSINIHFYADAILCDLSKAGACISGRPRAVECVSSRAQHSLWTATWEEYLDPTKISPKCVTLLSSYQTTDKIL